MATVSIVSPAAAAPAALEALRAKAEELESVFLAQILRELTQGLIGPLGNPENDPFAAMLQDEHAKLISRSGGIGIADAVLREMLKAQEAA